jgi:hypothetical protein
MTGFLDLSIIWSSAKVKNDGSIPPLPLMSSWRSAKIIEHRDNFTFLPYPSSGILKNTTFWKLDLFPSIYEGVGDTYSVGSIRKSKPKSLT